MIKRKIFSLVFCLLSALVFDRLCAQTLSQSNYPELRLETVLSEKQQGKSGGISQEALPSVPMAAVPSLGSFPGVVNVPAPREQLVVVSPAPPGKIFGSQLFGGTFRGTLNQGFNADYVISIGDRLHLRMWGGFNFENNVAVDAQGNIFVPNVGPVGVAGVRSGDLNKVIERGIRRVFKRTTSVYVALDTAQPVKVFVTGFVRQPGLYGGIASDSPISYIDKAGGVDQHRGSYLDIVVKRNGVLRKRVNLYDFLLDGSLDVVQFQDGDVILIGPRRHTFSVAGEVLNAYDFEFMESSIPLTHALKMARIRPGATHVSVVRRQGSERRSEYYPLDKADQIVLHDGDNVTLSADRYAGTIQIRVEGAHSGEHAVVLPYGAKLKDVLASIKPNVMSRMDAIQLYRNSVRHRQQEMLAVALQKISEAALSARSKTIEEANLRSKEAEMIMRFVDHAKQVKPKGQVILDESQRAETLLEDGDVVFVPERTSLVMVHGEVVFPNAVSWQKGNAVGDYVGQAGGFTQSANTSKMVVIRQNGATVLADTSTDMQAGDEIIVLPQIETKSMEVTRALTAILYQLAFTAKVAFGNW